MSGGNKETVGGALAACRSAVVGIGLFSLCENLLMLTVPIYSLQTYDRVLTTRSHDTLALLTVVAVGALLVLCLIDLARAQLLSRVGMWLDARLSARVLEAAHAGALRGEDRGVQGLRDLGQLRTVITGPGTIALFDLPTVPLYLAVVYFVHPLLGYVGLAGAALLAMIALASMLLTRRRLNEAGSAGIAALNSAQAGIRNADSVAAMGMSRSLLRRWENENGRILALHASAYDRLGTFGAFSKIARLLVQIAGMGAGAYLAIEQHITGGMMIAVAIILARGLAPIEAAIGSWNAIVAGLEAYRRVRDGLAKLPARAESVELPRPSGHLQVEKAVAVPPGGGKPILKGVSFEVQPGEMLGVIGPTAAGKSTLARLLVGSWRPAAGSVRLDGAEVYAWDRVDLGRHLGYLPQDIQLFPGTVAENIARMDSGAAAEAIVAAAQLAGVHEMVLQLPSGYETKIEEGGIRLSGGQRQRVALARALYRDPQLVVLDEPNSNLDTAGEEALTAALAALRKRGTTVILITHRPNILQLVDKIAVIKEGQTDTVGPREEVLSRMVRPAGAVIPAFARQSR